jgi:hypothetical protein
MSNLIRYQKFVDEFGKSFMLESDSGEWVKFDDIKELRSSTANNKQSTPFHGHLWSLAAWNDGRKHCTVCGAVE